MNVAKRRIAVHALALVLLASAGPAFAQWTRIVAIPAAPVFSLWARGDTIVAGADTVLYVSTDGGGQWSTTSRPDTGAFGMESARIRNGRLYAGTLGRGVFVSDDRGQTWQAYNQGLVGGLFNSHLNIADLVVRGDSLYAATLGAGVYVRNLVGAGTWSPFGNEFEENQAANVNGLALGGSRLLAVAGSNGQALYRDPGAAGWSVTSMGNDELLPGAQSQAAAWNGQRWVVGTGFGVFHSVDGDSPWTFAGPNLGILTWTSLVTQGRRFFVAFDRPNATFLESSDDDGVTWQLLETQPGIFVYRLAMVNDELYAARGDGLWRRSVATVAVPEADPVPGLHFAIVGAQPIRDVVRFRFDLPAAGAVSIDVFDVAGRRVAEVARESDAAGPHEASWNARALPPGVYAARLVTDAGQRVVRLVRVR